MSRISGRFSASPCNAPSPFGRSALLRPFRLRCLRISILKGSSLGLPSVASPEALMLYSSGCIGVRKPYLAPNRTEEASQPLFRHGPRKDRGATRLTSLGYLHRAPSILLLGPRRF